jgi:diguanylate cyclase (GGDEF)-like protein/PAS domain S-box-containing protein
VTHSVESRFIAIVSGTLLIVVAPLFTLFLALSSQQASENIRSHVDVVLDSNSRALGKPLWDLDVESIEQVITALAADKTIAGVQVTDSTGKLNLNGGITHYADNGTLTPVSRAISYPAPQGLREVGTVTVYVAMPGWFSALHEMEFAFVSIFIVAILTVFGAAIIGNRLMVIKPLMRLTAAVEATRRLGSRHHVDWRSSDEMGRLAKSFNEMQTLLEQEEREIRRAHQQATELYNLTPAMLFSLTSDDHIAAVSDYWLLATGYRREDVIGRPFVELVSDEDRETYTARKRRRKSGGTALELTVRFRCRDGRLIDVLIVETELAGASAHVTGSLSVMTDVTQLKQSELRNLQQAVTDHLTGLLNRQGFEAALETGIAGADRAKLGMACLFIDLDRFKSINDNLGHSAGDAVLRQFVERIAPMLRAEDTAARLGGDEFAILLPGADCDRRSHELCQKIVDMFEVPFRIQGTSVRLSASIGLAFYPDQAASAGELLQKSDLAMYARKRDGKNGAQVFDESMLDKTRERAEIESDIELGVTASWFEAHLQPIVDIVTGRPIGFEALMRMRHPRKGLIPPASIIRVAEENGTIGQIGALVLEDAVANLARISRLPGMQDTYVAVNFSPLQFDPALPTRLAALLGRYGILPSRLVVEITEAVLMHDNPAIRTILNEIHDFGCAIALDDFGTGYSSLSYLSRFPVDIVKIDQSFVRSLCEPGSDVARKNTMLVEGIRAISHQMNCKVIAEGIETEEQRSLLVKMGIDYAQGYYFSKPREISELLTVLSVEPEGITSMAG